MEAKTDYYPPKARREGAVGKVNVVFSIGQNGRALDPIVESSDSEALNAGALAFVNAAQFEVGQRSAAELKRRYTFAFYFDITQPGVRCAEWEAPNWVDYSKAFCVVKYVVTDTCPTCEHENDEQ
jgi:TonB family protein